MAGIREINSWRNSIKESIKYMDLLSERNRTAVRLLSIVLNFALFTSYERGEFAFCTWHLGTWQIHHGVNSEKCLKYKQMIIMSIRLKISHPSS